MPFRVESTIEVNWNAYVAFLNTAEAMLRHADFGDRSWAPAKTEAEREAEINKSASGEICAPGYCREAAGLFCAFAFEAYLNHLLREEHPSAADLDRLPWEGKLRVITQHLGMRPDMGSAPFQRVKALFKLRDLRAHGRDILVKKSVSGEIPYDFVQSETWWARISQADAESFLEDTRAAIRMLNAARPTPNESLFSQPISQASSTLIPAE